MTSAEKLQFIHELIEAVADDIRAKVDDMPEEWDGVELRRYIADRFEDQVFVEFRGSDVRGFGRDKRLRAYQNECIARNL